MSDPFIIKGVPGPALVDDIGLNTQVKQVTDCRNPFSVHDVKFRLFERGCHLILDHPDPGPAADHLLAVLDTSNPSDIKPNRGIEFKGIPPGRGLRITKHYSYLHTNLVDKDNRGLRFADGGGQFP